MRTFSEALEAVRVIPEGPAEQLYESLVTEINDSTELYGWIKVLEGWVASGDVTHQGAMKLAFLRGVMCGIQMERGGS